MNQKKVHRIKEKINMFTIIMGKKCHLLQTVSFHHSGIPIYRDLYYPPKRVVTKLLFC